VGVGVWRRKKIGTSNEFWNEDTVVAVEVRWKFGWRSCGRGGWERVKVANADDSGMGKYYVGVCVQETFFFWKREKTTVNFTTKHMRL